MSEQDEIKSIEKKRHERIERATKMMDISKNPCLKEHKLSLKCLSDHNYNKDSCRAVFENYKTCNDFWNSVETDRRRKGIYPRMPPPEDREEVKAQYMAKKYGTAL